MFAYLHRRKIHIACLQETHLSGAELAKVVKRWHGQVYGTYYSAFARGVLIWVAPETPFVKTRVVIDPEGRTVVLEGLLDGRAINVVAVYGPNLCQREFLEGLSSACFMDQGAPGLWAGDFNCVQSTMLDRSAPPHPGTQGIRVTQGFQS